MCSITNSPPHSTLPDILVCNCHSVLWNYLRCHVLYKVHNHFECAEQACKIYFSIFIRSVCNILMPWSLEPFTKGLKCFGVHVPEKWRKNRLLSTFPGDSKNAKKSRPRHVFDCFYIIFLGGKSSNRGASERHKICKKTVGKTFLTRVTSVLYDFYLASQS